MRIQVTLFPRRRRYKRRHRYLRFLSPLELNSANETVEYCNTLYPDYFHSQFLILVLDGKLTGPFGE
jgi:hypothetical protein